MVFSGGVATIARTTIRPAEPMTPASDSLAAPRTAGSPRLAPDAPAPVKVLVVDDHPLILEALRHVLSQLGTEPEVFDAASADAAGGWSTSIPMRAAAPRPRAARGRRVRAPCRFAPRIRPFRWWCCRPPSAT
jgi:hypothetical protein